jgi:protein farnesyltransferase subunit beta
MLDDDLPTATSREQTALEKKVLPFYQEFEHFQPEELSEVLGLLRTPHIAYLQNGLGQLPASFASLDSSRPWICYWILHSLALLDARLPASPSSDNVVAFLACCQSPHEGGYGGGPMQMAHMAPTYAAVSALVTLGTDAALKSLDRPKIWQFLSDMCIPPERGGGFSVHKGG